MTDDEYHGILRDVHRMRSEGLKKYEVEEALNRGSDTIKLAGQSIGINWADRTIPKPPPLPDVLPRYPKRHRPRKEDAAVRYGTEPCGCGNDYCGGNPAIEGHRHFGEDLRCPTCGVHILEYRAIGGTCKEWSDA